MTFEAGNLIRLSIRPIELGFEMGAPLKGLPVLAEGAASKEIFDCLRVRSAAYGTRMTQSEDGCIHIELDKNAKEDPNK